MNIRSHPLTECRHAIGVKGQVEHFFADIECSFMFTSRFSGSAKRWRTYDPICLNTLDLTESHEITRDFIILFLFAGFLLFVAGLTVNIHSDWILRNLRRPGEVVYKIPYGTRSWSTPDPDPHVFQYLPEHDQHQNLIHTEPNLRSQV